MAAVIRTVAAGVAGAVMLSGCAGAPGRADLAAAPRAVSPLRHPAPVAVGLEAEERPGEDERRGLHKFDQPGEAAAFFMAQRLGPGMASYPLEQVVDAQRAVQARRQAIDAARSPEHPGDITAWSPLGPGNVGGRTRAIAIDPTSPDTMYAAGVNGGVWKSTDAGASWTALDDFLPNIAVSAIAIDPTNTSVIYAGTGEGVGGSSTFPRGLGIFKSIDAGATWQLLESTVSASPAGAFHYVNKVVISPNDPARLYAATRTGVWRSLDAGETWSVVLANPRFMSGPQQTNGCGVGCLDLVARTDTDPDTLFAAFGSFERDGLFRSTDGGETWSEFVTAPNQGRMSLAIAPSNNDVIYASMADNGSGAPVGQLVDVFRSTDGGDTWEGRVNFSGFVGPWLLSNLVTATGCIASPLYSQGWHDNAIAVDPTDPDVVWVGGIDLFRSDDGGMTFGIAAYWFAAQIGSIPDTRYTHADQHVIVFHPNYDGVTNSTMYAGNDGGLYRTDNALGATTQEDCPFGGGAGPLPDILWTDLNNGYAVTQFYHGDSARSIDRFAGGAQDNGSILTNSRDSADDWVAIGGGDGGYVAIDPRNPDVIFTEIQGFPTIRKSLNGGAGSFPATNGITDTDGLFITPFAMDQANPDVLWTGGRRPWRTTNSALSWQVAGPDLPAPATISAIAVAPSDSNVVYLGYNNGYVARSTNALAASPTWTIVSGGLPVPFNWASSVAVDPVDPDIAYVSYSTFGSGHVYRTVNGGASWARIDGAGDDAIPDIPVHWVTVRPSDRSQLYAATELGVFASDDSGAAWRPTGPGMPTTVVESLDWKDSDTLVAFTHGRGAFIADLLPGCSADLSGDGLVGGADLGLLLGSWGTPAGDLSGDGQVNGADLGLLLGAWGPCL